MNPAICAAIRARAIVRFTYNGGNRTVEPHCHGVSRADKEVLRGYQTGGASSSGEPVGWKLFEVDLIVGFGQTDSTFSSNRPDYNPNDKHMKEVHCNV